MKERPRVVILGGGIGGIKAAQKLANQPMDVLIIDHNNYQVFQPLLYQVATSMLSTDEVVYPIRGFLISFWQKSVASSQTKRSSRRVTGMFPTTISSSLLARRQISSAMKK